MGTIIEEHGFSFSSELSHDRDTTVQILIGVQDRALGTLLGQLPIGLVVKLVAEGPMSGILITKLEQPLAGNSNFGYGIDAHLSFNVGRRRIPGGLKLGHCDDNLCPHSLLF